MLQGKDAHLIQVNPKIHYVDDKLVQKQWLKQ